jgi:hypothetical protein
MNIEEKIEAAIRETLVIGNAQSMTFCMKKVMKIISDVTGPTFGAIDKLQMDNEALKSINSELRKHFNLVEGETIIGHIKQLQAEKKALIADLENVKEIANRNGMSEIYCAAFNAIEGLRDIDVNKPARTVETHDQSLQE